MQRTIYFILSWMLCPAFVFADGGTLRLSLRCGEYQISVFTSPAVLRAGPIDVSVLVQAAATSQICDDIPISVKVHLADQPALGFDQPATTSAATNKLFRAALFDLPRSGTWQANVLVGEGTARESVPLTFDFDVAPPPPAWAQLAPWIGWPLLLAALFVWHQRLVSRREIKIPRGLAIPRAKPSAPLAGTAR